MTETAAGRAESIRSEFARRRRRQMVVHVLLGLAAQAYVVWLLGVFTDAQFLRWGPWYGLGVCALLAAGRLNWRCPACTNAPGQVWRARFCQSCGTRPR